MRSMKIIKSCYLDANLLVYYQDKSSPFHKQTKLIFEKLFLEKVEIILSSLSLDEYEYTIFRSGVSKSELMVILKKGLRKILKIPGVKLINPPVELKKHLKVLKLMQVYNLKPRDAYHLFMMLENKVRFLATFDDDFKTVFKKGRIKKFA